MIRNQHAGLRTSGGFSLNVFTADELEEIHLALVQEIDLALDLLKLLGETFFLLLEFKAAIFDLLIGRLLGLKGLLLGLEQGILLEAFRLGQGIIDHLTGLSRRVVLARLGQAFLKQHAGNYPDTEREHAEYCYCYDVHVFSFIRPQRPYSWTRTSSSTPSLYGVE